MVSAGADLVHFDVMDNHYVPNLTVGPVVCEAIRPLVNVPIDVHLMVRPVDRIVPDFARAGANIISFHPEASEHVDRTIGLIKEQGCKAGLVLQSGDAAHASRSRHRQARSYTDHVRQPRLRRPEVHPRGVEKDHRRARSHPDRRGGKSGSRSMAESRWTTSPKLQGRGRTPLSPDRRSSERRTTGPPSPPCAPSSRRSRNPSHGSHGTTRKCTGQTTLYSCTSADMPLTAVASVAVFLVAFFPCVSLVNE